MNSNSSNSSNNNISPNEYLELTDVLDEYLIEPKEIKKIRSVYKVICDDRSYCLKKLRHDGRTKALKGINLTEYLVSKGFFNTAKYFKTHNDKAFVKKGHFVYYLTQWINGREVDFDDFEELKQCVALLANFHLKSRGFCAKDLKMKSNIKNWPSLIKKRKDELEKIRLLIKERKIKTSFDLKYLNLIDEGIEQINFSLELLDKPYYMGISNRAWSEKTICHDSFYYQNIIINNSGKMYIVDLDSIVYDIHVYDLAKLINRILYRKAYGWNFDIAKQLIDIYSEIRPLSKDEHEILLAFLIFPQKFYKIGKKRYLKKKKWTEDRYLRKLNKYVKYIDRQREFFRVYLEYYINNNIKKE